MVVLLENRCQVLVNKQAEQLLLEGGTHGDHELPVILLGFVLELVEDVRSLQTLSEVEDHFGIVSIQPTLRILRL